MYAIVRSGGRQEKVAVGDVIELDRQPGKPGTTLVLPALLVVDGDQLTTDADALAGVTVTAEVLDHTKGPKIVIQKFKNKTGYKKRQGHRQRLTQVQVTGIETTGSTTTGSTTTDTTATDTTATNTTSDASESDAAAAE